MKLRPFELTLVVIFGVLMVLAIVLLRTYSPTPDKDVVSLGGAVTIWGTLPAEAISAVIRQIADTNDNYKQVFYRYVPASDFDEAFVNALADGRAPDLLLLSHEGLVKQRSRLQPFSYEAFPLRDFRTLYVDGAEIFALQDGIYGYPIAVDPLMMYWNRDIFSFNNKLTAPTTWEEVVADIVPQLTIRDYSRTINQSALAMGEYQNIKNAFPVISMLLLQGGSALVTEDKSTYRIQLDQTVSGGEGRPFATALTFYTNFNSMANTLYSWNRALALDRDLFFREELALYFGFGSEGKELAAKNPNLNFDIAPVPQGAIATARRTYGRFYALMVPKGAKNKAGAYIVMKELGNQTRAKALADAYNLAPVHRSSLAGGSDDVYGRVVYAAVPLARGWLNPDPKETDLVLIKLLEDINGNRGSVSSATGDAAKRLEQVY